MNQEEQTAVDFIRYVTTRMKDSTDSKYVFHGQKMSTELEKIQKEVLTLCRSTDDLYHSMEGEIPDTREIRHILLRISALKISAEKLSSRLMKLENPEEDEIQAVVSGEIPVQMLTVLSNERKQLTALESAVNEMQDAIKEADRIETMAALSGFRRKLKKSGEQQCEEN